MKKFYIGARHIGAAIAGKGENAACQFETVEEAVEEAKRLIREENREVVVIAEAIRIVRRTEPPIVVEKVK